jgi:hypothetical protein
MRWIHTSFFFFESFSCVSEHSFFIQLNGSIYSIHNEKFFFVQSFVNEKYVKLLVLNKLDFTLEFFFLLCSFSCGHRKHRRFSPFKRARFFFSICTVFLRLRSKNCKNYKFHIKNNKILQVAGLSAICSILSN